MKQKNHTLVERIDQDEPSEHPLLCNLESDPIPKDNGTFLRKQRQLGLAEILFEGLDKHNRLAEERNALLRENNSLLKEFITAGANARGGRKGRPIK